MTRRNAKPPTYIEVYASGARAEVFERLVPGARVRRLAPAVYQLRQVRGSVMRVARNIWTSVERVQYVRVYLRGRCIDVPSPSLHQFTGESGGTPDRARQGKP